MIWNSTSIQKDILCIFVIVVERYSILDKGSEGLNIRSVFQLAVVKSLHVIITLWLNFLIYCHHINLASKLVDVGIVS